MPAPSVAVPVAALLPIGLNLANAALYLGVKPAVVRQLVKAGCLPVVRVPLPPDARGRRKNGLRRLLFDRESLTHAWQSWQRGSDA